MILGVIYIWALLKPEAAPQSTETFPLKEKIAALKTPLPIIAIFAVMIVGIYRGIFSPSEAAGMGVIFTLVMMVLLGKFTWRLSYGALRGHGSRRSPSSLWCSWAPRIHYPA